MYEELIKQPITFKIEQHKIDALRFERFYPEALVSNGSKNSDFLRKVILKDIAEGLANGLDKYIDYYTEFCPHLNTYRLSGEIMVVNRQKTRIVNEENK